MSKVDLDYRDYGWLSTQGGRQNGAAVGTVYHYGYPAYGSPQYGSSSDSGVVAHWKFDDVAGDHAIVDEVSSISIPERGTPTYEVAVGGVYAGLTPGITTVKAGTNYFDSATTAVPEIAFGTSSAVIEFWVKHSADESGYHITYWSSNKGWYLYRNATATIFEFGMIADDNTAVAIALDSAPVNIADGNMHKVRIVINRAGNLEMFLDGVSAGTGSLAALSGKNFGSRPFSVGGLTNNGGGPITATFYELRITVGNILNNSDTAQFEPQVKLQYLFDEASGDIVDEIGGVTIPDVGSPTYSVAAAGSFSGLSPGITHSNTAYFQKAGADTSFNIGTSDATIECWYKTTNAGNDNEFWWHKTAGVGSGYSFQINTAGTKWTLNITSTDSTQINLTVTPTVGWNNGNLHKIRIVYDRSGNEEVFLDGVSLGTGSLAGISGKSVEPQNVCFGNYVGGGYSFQGTFYEWRFSLNATNNSNL